MKFFGFRSPRLCYLLAVLLVVGPFQFTIALAQNAAIDFEIPTITTAHVEEETDGNLDIEVGAIDNVAITEVSLFYRYSENDLYQQVQLFSSGGDLFSAQLASVGAGEIQHYFVATDSSGNKTQRGNSYFPQVTELTGQGSSGLAHSKPKYLYYILGALAVGVIAAIAGGGEGSDGEPATCCTVIVNTTPQ